MTFPKLKKDICDICNEYEVCRITYKQKICFYCFIKHNHKNYAQNKKGT